MFHKIFLNIKGNEKRELIIQTIHFSKTKLFGHLIQYNELLNMILEGMVLNQVGRKVNKPEKDLEHQGNYVTHTSFMNYKTLKQIAKNQYL